MKTYSTLLITGILLIAATLAGCATKPDAKVAEAEKALAAADSVEADVYVADLYQAARDSFAAAQVEMEAQDGQASRHYAKAEHLLQVSIETAQHAAAQVDTRKEALRVETDSLIVQAQQAVAAAQELLTEAPRNEETDAVLVSVSEDAGSAEEMLNDAVAALANGEVAQAHDLAQAALDRANELIEAINGTLEAPRS